MAQESVRSQRRRRRVEQTSRLCDFAEERFCYLTTTGRISGSKRTVEIWFAVSGQTIYMLSGNGHRANWVKNAILQPDITIQIKHYVFQARARIVQASEEDALARRLLCQKYSQPDDGDGDWGTD